MQSQQSTSFQSHHKEHFSRLFPELEPLILSDREVWYYAERMMDWGGMENP
ncbi:MAG: hypothetical protein AAFU67_10295 [Bacteroidota bacterium]